MRKTVIYCDRCGEEIKGHPIRIEVRYVDRESGDICPPGMAEGSEKGPGVASKDFCERCTEKVVRYASGGLKENPEFKKAVEEMVKGSPPTDAEKNGNGVPGTGLKERPGKSKIDTGKVMALTKAGWPAAKIADEMGIGVQAVYDARYRLKKEGGL